MQHLKLIVSACAVVVALGGCAAQRMPASALPQARTVDAGAWQADRVEVGEQAAQMTLGDDGARLYVTGNGDNTLTVVNTRTHQVAKTIDGGEFETGLGSCPHNFCKGRGAAGVAVASGGDIAWVSSMKPDALSRVDLATGQWSPASMSDVFRGIWRFRPTAGARTS